MTGEYGHKNEMESEQKEKKKPEKECYQKSMSLFINCDLNIYNIIGTVSCLPVYIIYLMSYEIYTLSF